MSLFQLLNGLTFAALLFVATVVLVTRQVGRAGISTVLRSGEE